MEIRPVKNYKKPNYAVKLAALAAAAAALSGCAGGTSLTGAVPVSESGAAHVTAPAHENELSGTVTTAAVPETTSEKIVETDIDIMGMMSVDTDIENYNEPPETEITLSPPAESVKKPEYTLPRLEGGAPVPVETEDIDPVSKVVEFITGLIAGSAVEEVALEGDVAFVPDDDFTLAGEVAVEPDDVIEQYDPVIAGMLELPEEYGDEPCYDDGCGEEYEPDIMGLVAVPADKNGEL